MFLGESPIALPKALKNPTEINGMKNANVSMVKFGIEISWRLSVLLYECHIIPIAIKNIVDAFLQNGQIIRILKSETQTATLCRVSCCYPITIVYKKGFLKKRFFNSAK